MTYVCTWCSVLGFLLGFGKETGLSTALLVHTKADLSGCFKLLQMKEQSS